MVKKQIFECSRAILEILFQGYLNNIYRDYFLRKVIFYGMANLDNLFQFVRKK